jgi:NTP pyrophosphatase (non-canonical NTP hydrolase)
MSDVLDSLPTHQLSFAEYSEMAKSTARYPLMGRNMVYPALKMAGEAGELADKIGKHWRNRFNKLISKETEQETLMFATEPEAVTEDQAALMAMDMVSMTAEERHAVLLELGDVLWYVMALSQELGVTLEHVAGMNLTKLADRRARGTILGAGDNR